MPPGTLPISVVESSLHPSLVLLEPPMNPHSHQRAFAAPLLLGAALFSLSCGGSEPETEPEARRSASSAGPGGLDGPPSPTFVDVLASSGITFRHQFLDSETGSTYKINPYDHGSGVAVADVNGDGLDDIYFLDFLGGNQLYLNRGDMKFEDVSDASGVAVARKISVGAAFGDYDGDGDPDLYVTTYRGGNQLFQNDGSGVFVDVTKDAGVGYNGHSNSASFFDYDGDGDLDLYLCNIGDFTTETVTREAENAFFKGETLPFTEIAKTPDQKVPGEADRLFQNAGDGTFRDVTEEAGIVSTEWNGDVTPVDYDGDGDMDLYSANMFGANHLYRNDGGEGFAEVTGTALGRTSWGGVGASFFDANGDAHPDLYVVDMHSDMWMSQADGAKGLRPLEKFNTPMGGASPLGAVIKKPEDTFAASVLCGNTFFLGDGNGAFQERSREAGLENWWPWGLVAGDWNNDGHQDLFVTSGMGFPFVYWPNHLYVGDGSGTFRECARDAGIEPPRLGEVVEGAAINGTDFTRSSRTVACADFDQDGDLDLVVNNFNHEPYLFRNDTPEADRGHWIQLDLRVAREGEGGDNVGRPAYGARVELRTPARSWHRWVPSAEGYLSQSSSILHIGLGDTQTIDSVRVTWPGSGSPTVLENVEVDARMRIVQPR